MPPRIRIIFRVLILVLSVARSALGQTTPPDWTDPSPPFQIAGNLCYVGSKGLANYLIATPEGNILINSDLEANVPMIRLSIEKLGFKFRDTKILLISHAHWDHDAGSAMIKEMTGARYMVMDADVPVVESGGKADFQYGNTPGFLYRPTKVDRVLHDRDQVTLGGTVLVAHLTPGHTRGCTTWTMKVTDRDKTYDVVIIGSSNVNPATTRRQQSISADRRRLRTPVAHFEVTAMRYLPRCPRLLFRSCGKVFFDERRGREPVRRPGGLQKPSRAKE
jgi:metallo-beta-lactamase class B